MVPISSEEILTSVYLERVRESLSDDKLKA